MVDGIISMCSSVHGSSSLRELHVRKLRGSSYMEGVHNYKIAREGVVVYPRMETSLSHAPGDNGNAERITSGIPRLDAMLGGGLPRRSMTMLVGPSGTGKTTAGLQFLSKCSSDEPGLFFGFYETPARIQSKGRTLTAFGQALESGNVEMLWHPPTEWLLDELADNLIKAVRQRRVRRLFMDGLGGFRKALRSRDIEPFFAALVEELRGEGVTTVCTAEVAEIIGPAMSTGMSDITDNHIILRFIEAGANLYRIVSILKVRDSSFDSGLRGFSITGDGLEIAEDSRSAELVLSSVVARVRQPEIAVSRK